VNADAVDEGRFHLGLCDGVSGVQGLGIPPDALPRDLLRCCRRVLEEENATATARQEGKKRSADSSDEEDDSSWLIGVIQKGFEASEAFGATTLLLTALRKGDLLAACLGDSALLVLRPCQNGPLKFRSILKTEPGRYDSRRPVQIQRLHGFSKSHARTVIRGATVSSVPIEIGDVLILGSDGIFDNLEDSQIEQLVSHQCMGYATSGPAWKSSLTSAVQPFLSLLANVLVDSAIASVGPDGLGLSSKSTPGGKNPDDTTALVAVVTDTTFAASKETPWGVSGRTPFGDCTNFAHQRGPPPMHVGKSIQAPSKAHFPNAARALNELGLPSTR